MPHTHTHAHTRCREDPYAALQAVAGAYSWRAAEAVAARLGHDAASSARGGAALLHALTAAAAGEGHTQLTWGALREEASKLLAAPGARPWPTGAEGLLHAAREQRLTGRLVVELPGTGEPAPPDAWGDDAM